LAEQAARLMREPTLYVLVPYDTSPAGIEYARRYFTRIYRPQAGVWTVENGQFQAGYHLNVIADWSETAAPFKGHIYKERVRTNVRAVAAYISKAQRAATREEGFARASGALGTLANFLRQPNLEAPLIHAAQALHDIAPHFIPNSAEGPERPGDTAKRWLSPVYEAAANERHGATGSGAATSHPGEQDGASAPPPPAPATVKEIWAPEPPRAEPHPSNPEFARAWCAQLKAILATGRHAAPPPPPAGRGPEPPD
jgi:hypothetical protein